MNELNQRYSKEVTDIVAVSGKYPSIAQTTDGKTYVCYQEYKDRHDVIVAGVLTQEKGEFLEGAVISQDGEALKPVCVADGNRVWYAWGENKNQKWKIYYRSYENGVYSEVQCADE